MITIHDIANRAGVAPSTVSRVLSGNGKRSGFHVVLCNSNDDPGEERDCLELLVDFRVDGILITPTGKKRGLPSIVDVAKTYAAFLINYCSMAR